MLIVNFLDPGEKTVHWKVAFNALRDLGVDCFSFLCQGGNQPVNEFLDPNHPSMILWTAFSHIRGYVILFFYD